MSSAGIAVGAAAHTCGFPGCVEGCQQADSQAVFPNAQHSDAAERAQQLLHVPAPRHGIAILARVPLAPGLPILPGRSTRLAQLHTQQSHAQAFEQLQRMQSIATPFAISTS